MTQGLGQCARALQGLLAGDPALDRAVPPSGTLARLTLFAAAVMSFLAVFALALSLAAGRMAQSWSSELSRSATIRLVAPEAEREALATEVLSLLQETAGVVRAEALNDDQQRALLEPWFGPDLPVESLPLPQLIEIVHDGGGAFDGAALAETLTEMAPDAVLDDHTRWRAPLVRAAGALRAVAWICVILIVAVQAVVITLAARAALAANTRVIRVLRQVGAQDRAIAQAFVRKATLRAGLGAIAGVVVALLLLWLLPAAETVQGLITGLSLRGWGWGVVLLIPLISALVALVATRLAAMSALRQIP